MVDLSEAGARLRAYRPEPTPDIGEIVGRRDRRRRRRIATGGAGLVAMAGAVIAVAVALSTGSHSQQVATSPTANSASVPTTNPPLTTTPEKATFTITLDHTTVTAGTTIHGVVTVDNETGAPIPIPGGVCNGWPIVGISNRQVPFVPVNGGVGCGRASVPVGQTRYPITVITTYSVCNGIPAEASSSDPVCSDGGIPALPPGTYQTAVEESAGMTVKTETVTLTTP